LVDRVKRASSDAAKVAEAVRIDVSSGSTALQEAVHLTESLVRRVGDLREKTEHLRLSLNQIVPEATAASQDLAEQVEGLVVLAEELKATAAEHRIAAAGGAAG
jgi:ABC-type transporter Mla subunit MlaD